MIGRIEEQPLSTRLLRDVLIVQMLAVAPHAWHLAPAVVGYFYLLAALRLWRWPTPQQLPGPLLRITLMLIGLVLVITAGGSGIARVFGVAMLVAMLAVKLLELRSRRDLYVTLFIGLFVLVTHFLYSQSMLLVGYVLLVALGMITLLVAANRADGAAPFTLSVRYAGFMMAASLPAMLVLYLLFPRLEGPLWHFGTGGKSGVSGMADHVEMGAFSQLIQSDEPAFRVAFSGTPPPPETRYWRGMVLWQTDGRRWERGRPPTSSPTAIEPRGPAIEYEVTMEPSGKPWLFPLDRLLSASPPDLTLDANHSLERRQPIHKRYIYRAASATGYRQAELAPWEWEFGLQLPEQGAPRTRQLAARWQRELGKPDAIIDQALRLFREQAFYYTLSPPPLGDNPVDQFLFGTRRGFCEHYAAAFVTLMRAADIPARMVIGYQGGEYNPQGDYLIVYQSDAHAWAEVWLEDEGWVRVDPTAAVAPQRVERPIDRGQSGERITFRLDNPGLAEMARRQLRWFADNLNMQWHRWVVNFNEKQQHQLLRDIGLEWLRGRSLGLAAAGLALGVSLLAFLTLAQRQRRIDEPLPAVFKLLLRKLRRAGLMVSDAEAPITVARRAVKRFPQQTRELFHIVARYQQLRYGPEVPGEKEIGHLRREVRRLRLVKGQALHDQ